MTCDEGLAERIRRRLGPDHDVVEGWLYGGIAFPHRGNMPVGVSHDDRMMRVGPDRTDAPQDRPAPAPASSA